MNTSRFPALVSKVGQIAWQSKIGLALLGACVLCAVAQDGHTQTPALQKDQTAEQKSQASALIKIVRESPPQVSEALPSAGAWDT
jgi:hypothetical protein